MPTASAAPSQALAKVSETGAARAAVAAGVVVVEKIDHGVEDARVESRDAQKLAEIANRLQGIEGHSG